jgi:AraC-like DNA-binding protein
MFFETEGFHINILSVHRLEWENRSDNSGTRPYHALSFRILGNAKLIHNSATSKVSTNDIVFVPAYCEYELNSESEDLFVVHFESNDSLPTQIKRFTPENPAYFKRKFEELYTVWSKKQTSYIHECNSIFYRILMHIEREYIHAKHSAVDERLNEAVDYIHDNFTKSDISIEELAQLCNMSGTYFRKLFSEKYNTSPRAYINNLKLQYALELLKSNYYTVSEVSDKCGFKNIYYFSSFIKKETGSSPTKLELY